ncbi:hypothetical protein ACJX0J_038062 [Zea mays]
MSSEMHLKTNIEMNQILSNTSFLIGKEIAPLMLIVLHEKQEEKNLEKNKSYQMAVGLGSETEVLVKGMPNQVVEGLVSGRDNKIMFAAYFGFFSILWYKTFL